MTPTHIIAATAAFAFALSLAAIASARMPRVSGACMAAAFGLLCFAVAGGV
jgi:hypothetical protein